MRFCSLSLVVLTAGLCNSSTAQAQITWSGGAGGGTTWATTNNWVGGVIPGSSSNTANSDIAEFAAAGTSTQIGMNFNTSNLGTPFYVGTLNILSSHTVARTMGSNATPAGVVQFNGTGANNLILSNASNNILTLAPRSTGAGGNMTVRLNPTSSTISTTGSGGITISAVITENGTGKGITKVGSGLLTLSGDNTYSGATIVQAGELRVTGTTGSNTGTGSVSVESGATLSGTGRALPGIGNLVSVLNGGTIRGDSGTGTGTLTVGNTTVQNGGKLVVQHGSGTNASSLTMSSGSVLNLNTGAVIDPNGTIGGERVIANLATGSGLLVVGGTTIDNDGVIATYTHADGNNGLQTFGSLQLDITGLSLTAGDVFTLRRTGNTLVFVTPVPEPAFLLAVCGLAVGGVVGVRKLRRKAVAVG